MSGLRSMLDQLALTANAEMTVEELDTEIGGLLEGQHQIDVLLARRIAGLEERGWHTDLGYPSPTSYLMHRVRLSAGRHDVSLPTPTSPGGRRAPKPPGRTADSPPIM